MIFKLFASTWNKLIGRSPPRGNLLLGYEVRDGELSKKSFRLSERTRTEHIVIFGKTGTGKTSLLKSLLSQDVAADRGFLCIDLHGDIAPFVLGCIAKNKPELSSRVVLFNPADPANAVGLNILNASQKSIAVLVSEVVSILRKRWQLDHFGARTEELLRNALWVLAENGLTLIELAAFLTDLSFRSRLLQKVSNAEVKSYFHNRYGQLSEAMQTVVREAILNKISAFTTDPAIRHIIGQTNSFDIKNALDRGLWVILSLNKAALGENAEVLAALFLAQFKNAVFARTKRDLFTLYADEMHSLSSSAYAFESLLSESRKYGISVVTATQHLQQVSQDMRASLMSAGTSIFFRASSEDASPVARFLDGGNSLERQLKSLPNRHFLVRSGSNAYMEVETPHVSEQKADHSALIYMSNRRWAAARDEIETAIAERLPNVSARREELEEWK